MGTANYAAAKFLEIFEILPTTAAATVGTAGGALVLELKRGSTYPLDKFALTVALEKRFAAGFIKGIRLEQLLKAINADKPSFFHKNPRQLHASLAW